MSRILVLYGTTEGQTAKIAGAVAETLRAEGHAVDVAAAEESSPDARNYAGVVVAASVHGGRYQKPVRLWVAAHADALRAMPTAFVSVSLGVLQRDPKVQQEVAAIVDRFLTEAGWTPRMTTNVAGALVYTRYNWIKRWVMRRIARAAGGDTDVSRDYEYTDWKQVGTFAREFSRHIQGTPMQVPAA
jgi:menaquinone-dependent protoporphyrinogen oxidase